MYGKIEGFSFKIIALALLTLELIKWHTERNILQLLVTSAMWLLKLEMFEQYSTNVFANTVSAVKTRTITCEDKATKDIFWTTRPALCYNLSKKIWVKHNFN